MGNAWNGLQNNLNKTDIPHYALNKNLPADSYFTSKETATKCINILKTVCNLKNINLSKYTFIEPGAGAGGFFDLLPIQNRIGIDIIDRRDDVITADYLTWKPEDLSLNYCTIGNPPFGIRGAVALAFLNRSLLFSEIVAFILPMSFHSNGKGSAMSRVKNGHLIHSEILESEKFFSPDNNKEIKINTLFQIWKRGDGNSIFKNYDISEYADIKTINSDPNRYCGMAFINDYDFFIHSSFYGNGSDIKIVSSFNEVKYNAGYGIILKKEKKFILEKIKKVDWSEYSSVATNSCRHIRKHHIEKLFYDLGYGVEATQNTILKFT